MAAVGMPMIRVYITLPTSGLTEITDYVKCTGVDDIVITAGLSDEGTLASPSTCRFMVDNRDGRFSPFNTSGAWWGEIGINLPIYVETNYGSNAKRFTGYIDSLPMSWDQTAENRWVRISCSGASRQIANYAVSSSPLRFFLTAMGPGGSGYPWAYWPCEGEVFSGAPSAVGGNALALRGEFTPGGHSRWKGSDSIITLGASGSAKGSVPRYTPVGGRHILRVLTGWEPGTTYASDRPVIELGLTYGTISRAVVEYVNASNAFRLKVYSGNTLLLTSSTTMSPANQILLVQLTQNGTDIDYRLHNAYTNSGVSGTISGRYVGYIRSVEIAPDGNVEGMSFGHVHVSSDVYDSTRWMDVNDPGDPGSGIPATTNWTTSIGEKASDRIQRICTALYPGFSYHEQAPAFGDSEAMGPMDSGTPSAWMAECAQADGGILSDAILSDGVEYRVRRSMYHDLYNTDLLVDVSASTASSPPNPSVDDKSVITHSAVSRKGGGSAEYSVESTAPRSKSETVNVASDVQAASIAEWNVSLGQNSATRIPTLTFDLRKNTGLIPGMIALHVGDVVGVTNTVPDLGDSALRFLVVGWTEYLGFTGWRVALNLVPAQVWQVGKLVDHEPPFINMGSRSRLDTAGCTVGSNTSTSTSLVCTTATGSRLWTTDSDDVPFYVDLGTGERCQVTAVGSPSGMVQTLTVVRSVNGVVKAIPAGTSIKVSYPLRASL